MAVSNDAVLIGAPLTTGAIYTAAVGTTLPTDATAALDNAFKAGGYVSEDGLTMNRSVSTTDIRDWNLDIVRSLATDSSVTLDFTFLQTDYESMCEVFGAENVTKTTNGFAVNIGSDLPVRKSFVFNMKDGDKKLRIVLPDAQVTNVGAINFRKSDAIRWQVTVTAYAVNGKSAHIYMD